MLHSPVVEMIKTNFSKKTRCLSHLVWYLFNFKLMSKYFVKYSRFPHLPFFNAILYKIYHINSLRRMSNYLLPMHLHHSNLRCMVQDFKYVKRYTSMVHIINFCLLRTSVSCIWNSHCLNRYYFVPILLISLSVYSDIA